MNSSKPVVRELFSPSPKKWGSALLFLSMLSLVGLGLWPIWILIILFLINRFIRSKEEFIVDVFILSTGSGFIDLSAMPFKFTDILIIVSLLLIPAFKFGKTINRINLSIALYFSGILAIALMSREPVLTQLRLMRYYALIIAYLVPYFLIKRGELDVKGIGYYIVLYSIVLCLFYLIDGFIFSGFVLIPNTSLDGNIGFSTWDNLYWAPLTSYFPRKYPPGLYILMLGTYIIARNYRMPWYCKIIIALALIACRTISFIIGLAVVYVAAVTEFRFRMKYIALSILCVCGLYIIDKYTTGFLRISTTLEQFVEFKEAYQRDDIEKMAEFGSGRLAQAIPKIDLLMNRGRLWTGFGFLHPEISSNTDLLYRNPLYSDQSKEAVEIPAEVEITQVQTLLNVGIAGLLLQTLFYIFLVLYLRKKYIDWFFFLAVVVGVSVSGLGGFIGLSSVHSLWVALTLALVCCGEKKKKTNANANANIQALSV